MVIAGDTATVWLPCDAPAAPKARAPISAPGAEPGCQALNENWFRLGETLVNTLYVVEMIPNGGVRVAVTPTAQSFGPPEVPDGFEQPSPMSGTISPRNRASVASPAGAGGSP